MASDGIRLHIGGTDKKEGWRILNVQPGPAVDYVANVNDLAIIPEASCAEVYASHVLEHLGYDGELQASLKGLYRVLAPGGRLRVSVPDLRTLCHLFVDPNMQPQDQWKLMRMMFGGRLDAYDVHYCGLTHEFLELFLTEAGFRDIKRVGAFDEFDDQSKTTFAGRLISLNMQAIK